MRFLELGLDEVVGMVDNVRRVHRVVLKLLTSVRAPGATSGLSAILFILLSPR